MNAYFTSLNINRSTFPVVVKKMKCAVKPLMRCIDTGTSIDMDDLFCNVTMDVTCNILFSWDCDASSSSELTEFVDCFNAINAETAQRVSLPGYQYFPIPSKIRYFNKRRSLFAQIGKIINERQTLIENNGEVPNDVITSMLKSEDKFTFEDVRSEALGTLFAGHDTTGHTMSFALYEILRNPDIYAKVMEELDTELPFNGLNDMLENITPDHLHKLKYLTAVLKETLRLYTPVLGFSLTTTCDTTLGGYSIPNDTGILFLIYAVHHNPKYWPDPEKFDPERFLSAENQASVDAAFMPFSIGRHSCIGKGVMMLESRLILSTLLKHYQFRFAEGYTFECGQYAVARPKNGVVVHVSPRVEQ